MLWAFGPLAEAEGILVRQTDFGQKDHAVAAMRGVARQVDRNLVIDDLTHDIPALETFGRPPTGCAPSTTIGRRTPYSSPWSIPVSVRTGVGGGTACKRSARGDAQQRDIDAPRRKRGTRGGAPDRREEASATRLGGLAHLSRSRSVRACRRNVGEWPASIR